MSWSRKEISRPPQPDVPLPPTEPMPPTAKSGYEPPSVENAKIRMAHQMENGRSPYDFGGELDNKGSGDGFVLKAITTVSLIALVLVIFFGWKFFRDVSGKLDGVNKNVTDLSANLKVQQDAYAAAGKAVVRSELRKTLITLDNAIALGDPAVTDRALKLRDDIKELLAAPYLKDGAAATPAQAPAALPPVQQQAAPQASAPAAPIAPAPVKQEGAVISPYGPAPTAALPQAAVKPAPRPAAKPKPAEAQTAPSETSLVPAEASAPSLEKTETAPAPQAVAQ